MFEFSGSQLQCIRGERVVFSGLSYSLVSGESLVLQGKNGSGKSSLLRIMAGLLKPNTGHINWIDDKTKGNLKIDNDSSYLNYLGHVNAIKPSLTVSENLDFWSGLIKAHNNTNIENALRRFEIFRLADLPARCLSAGQCRRLSLARLLTCSLPLWLLDEPESGLDSKSNTILNEVIEEHLGQGGLLVVANHSDKIPSNMKRLSLDDYSMELL